MKVLVALDDSAASVRAARSAARLFGAFPEVEFFVVNVAKMPAAWVGAAEFGFAAPMIVDPRWLEPDVATLEEDLERDLLDTAAATGLIEAEATVRIGDPVEQICAVADALAADVIVVGSHDKNALQRLLEPSVAAGVVRATHRPVLVVSGEPPGSS